LAAEPTEERAEREQLPQSREHQSLARAEELEDHFQEEPERADRAAAEILKLQERQTLDRAAVDQWPTERQARPAVKA
jgi:hypothetical protein